MPWAIVIEADESAALQFRLFNDYRDYQEVVGGTFQSIDLETLEASIFVHDEGKLLDLPLNRRATLLLWMHHPAFRGRDALFGDVVLVGPVDNEGDTQDLPEEIVTLLMRTELYKYEVETAEKEGKWYGNMTRYDSWVDAYNHALGLLDRWTLAVDVRVVAA